MRWSSESLFLLGDQYFDALIAAIEAASVSVDIEMYIFATDAVAQRVVNALCAAAKRAIVVRVIVDGVGSLGWLSRFGQQLELANVELRIYHALPFAALFGKYHERGVPHSFWTLVRRINRRTHRKLIIIDNQLAFVGSRNLTDVHSERVMQQNAWRDLSAAVTGPGLSDLQRAFERSWLGAKMFSRLPKATKQFIQDYPELVRLNVTRRIRRWHYRNLLARIANANKRVWIVTGYFVPHRSLVRVLAAVAGRGIDVRIIVPAKSDVFFYPFVGAAFQYELMRAGALIFEYLPAVSHSKAMIIDDYAILGSSNLNHRSLLHDLEVDVILSSRQAICELEQRCLDDLEQSRALSPYKSNYSLWHRVIGRLALLFKRNI